MATARIPAAVAALLREALYAQLTRAFEDAPDEMPAAQSRAGWADVLGRIKDARTALDVIGWEAPARQRAVEVELDRAMIDALEADVDSWEWLADAVTTETVAGRRRAAAKAKMIARFLASVTKDGDA